MSTRLWSVTGLCEELGVGQGAITNWRNRYPDTPPPTHHVYSGQAQFTHEAWDAAGLEAWRQWYEDHQLRMAHRYRRTREKEDQ
jgi:hypothetical protein